MDEKLVNIKAKMFKHRVRSYQLAQYLKIQEYLLSRMLNGHIELPAETEQKIEAYFEQFENQPLTNAK